MTSCFRKQLSDAQCKGIKDSGSHSVDSGFKYLSVELGFWIQNVSGISDSLSCIPDSTSKIFPDLGFHKQKFPGFGIPQAKQFPGFGIPRAKISRIWYSTSKIFPGLGFHKQKFPGFLESGFHYMGRFNASFKNILKKLIS